MLFMICLLILKFKLSYSDELDVSNSVLFFTEDILRTAELEVNNTVWSIRTIQVQCSKAQVLKELYGALSSPPPLNPVAVVSGVCPEATEALAEVSKYYCLPVVSYSTSIEFPSDHDQFPHLFSVVPSDHYFAVGVARLISYYNWQRTVVITQDSNHFKRIKDNLLSSLKSNPVINISDLLLPLSLSRLHNTNFFALRENLKRYSYVWIIPGWYADRWWTLGGNVILEDFTCNSTDLSSFITQQRVIIISHYPTSGDNMVSQKNGNCEYPKRTLVHDAIQAIIHGLNWTLTVVNDSSCNDRVESPICSPEVDTCFNTTLNAIKTVNFQGESGFIEFDDVGARTPDVVNVFQYRTVETCPVHVAIINITTATLSIEFVDGNDALWVGGVLSDGSPRTVMDFIPLWLSVTANLWCGLVILCSIVFITFMCIFRKRKLVRLTSPSLNYVIAIGIIMFNIGGMMFIQPQVPFTVLKFFCAARVWFVTIGISFCYVTINVKMWRIYYIFHYPNPSKRKKVFQDWHLFLIVMMCVVLDVVVLTIATSVSSARLKPVATDDVRHGTEVDSDGITLNYQVFLCESRWKLIWLGFLFGYKALIIMISLALALKTRNVKIDILNDSKEIAMTIYLTTVILCVVILVSVVPQVEQNLTLYGAVYAYGTALATSTVLIIVFFTKVYKLYKDPWGEKIFTNEHGTGANALTGTGAGACTVTATLGSDDNRVHVLESRLRQVEMELRKCKNGDMAMAENKTGADHLYYSAKTDSEDKPATEPSVLDLSYIMVESETSMQPLEPQ